MVDKDRDAEVEAFERWQAEAPEEVRRYLAAVEEQHRRGD